MNLLDLIVILVLMLYVLYGYYRGFFHSVLSIGAYILSWGAGMLFFNAVGTLIKGNESIYNTMLYYTEGSEYIGNVELTKTPVSQINLDQLGDLIAKSTLPHPMGEQVKVNVSTEAFSDLGITTLGDYFNQTIVCVFINIIAFLLIFAAVRLILGLIINSADHAGVFPALRHSDSLIGAGFGALRGVLALFLLMMLTPIALTILPFDFIREQLDSSFFAPFFYHSNFLLSLIPGV
ncbi:MAG: CvpA family protein [Bacillota bacterium]